MMKRLLGLFAISALFCLFAAGCKSEGDAGSGTDAAAPSSTTSAVPPKAGGNAPTLGDAGEAVPGMAASEADKRVGSSSK